MKKYHLFLNRLQLTTIQAALGFVTSLKEVDVVLCGVENSIQLLELIQAPKLPSIIDWRPFALNDPEMINPALWKLK